jgi:hypothetical protein
MHVALKSTKSAMVMESPTANADPAFATKKASNLPKVSSSFPPSLQISTRAAIFSSLSFMEKLGIKSLRISSAIQQGNL